MNALEKLQNLLRDLFQFDQSDLDFGLYRLLRIKRDEIEAFLTVQLPKRVEESFQGMAAEERAVLEKEVSEFASRIRREVAEEAILASGEVAPEYRESKIKIVRDLVKIYESGRKRLQSVQATEAQKAEVFNHLYEFFRRTTRRGISPTHRSTFIHAGFTPPGRLRPHRSVYQSARIRRTGSKVSGRCSEVLGETLS